ncbi:hypothetical protein [Algibacter luteus]|uniref:hypothetical protein n=1 Tax=Algibacter luteus TaxID=1178825 RepID=UPI0025945325|nr:hypothetical protein [Algibacter luteus]WJJ97410.1 hypothetical protein O5O44_03305 [Algibacter luteus]
MKNEIILDNVKFWLDQDIIHATFNSHVDKSFIEFEAEVIFIEVIKAMSYGKYRPILIDLSGVSRLNSIRLFKLFSSNAQIKSLVLSKSFIVKSLDLKFFLELFKIGSPTIVPIKISTDYTDTLKFCNENYAQFNASY